MARFAAAMSAEEAQDREGGADGEDYGGRRPGENTQPGLIGVCGRFFFLVRVSKPEVESWAVFREASRGHLRLIASVPDPATSDETVVAKGLCAIFVGQLRMA